MSDDSDLETNGKIDVLKIDDNNSEFEERLNKINEEPYLHSKKRYFDLKNTRFYVKYNYDSYDYIITPKNNSIKELKILIDFLVDNKIVFFFEDNGKYLFELDNYFYLKYCENLFFINSYLKKDDMIPLNISEYFNYLFFDVCFREKNEEIKNFLDGDNRFSYYDFEGSDISGCDISHVVFFFDMVEKYTAEDYKDSAISYFTKAVIYNGSLLYLEFFKLLYDRGLVDFFKNIYEYKLIYDIIETDQPNIIDYLIKKKFIGKEELNKKFKKSKILFNLIKKDNMETFIYVITQLNVPSKIILDLIELSGSIITKDYVKILYNNNKLKNKDLKLLATHTKNNPDKNLKKYVKKIINSSD